MLEPDKIKRKAVVLLSGGLDSSTVLAIAKNEMYEIYALSFDYGQKNRFELERASHIAIDAEVVEHKMLLIDLRNFGGSSLTSDAKVENNRRLSEIGIGIPSTYVPARNTLFLSYSLAWAEVLGASDIFIGVNAVDTSGYPDCRPEYIAAYEQMANLGTRIGDEKSSRIRIHTPLQKLRKSEIISLGLQLGVDYSKTNTCYDPKPQGLACGICDACILRRKGFAELDLVDPLAYQS